MCPPILLRSMENTGHDKLISISLQFIDNYVWQAGNRPFKGGSRSTRMAHVGKTIEDFEHLKDVFDDLVCGARIILCDPNVDSVEVALRLLVDNYFHARRAAK